MKNAQEDESAHQSKIDLSIASAYGFLIYLQGIFTFHIHFNSVAYFLGLNSRPYWFFSLPWPTFLAKKVGRIGSFYFHGLLSRLNGRP